jgi:hypothetical protein
VASRARALLASLIVLAAVLAVAGCVSVPSAGPVLSYPVGQQTSGQNGQNLQVIAAGPGAGWKPNNIVTGFLTAAAAIGDQQVAQAYLTPAESKNWKPSGSVYVYKTGPYVQNPIYPKPAAKPQPSGKGNGKGKGGTQAPQRATVFVDGKVSANLSGHGTYAVPSTSATFGPQVFDLVEMGGQWRISSAPLALLLTQAQFADDYELRNLYFFDPNDHYLVPDPVYVPLQATTTNLINRLVNELIMPPNDWLARATQTAFPAHTKIIGGVTLTGGTAAVNLGGAIATAPNQKTLLAQVSAQLLLTLVGSGQSGSQVQTVELLVNGQAKYPQGNSQGIAVQHVLQAAYQPAYGTGGTFYYVDSAGYLCRRNGMGGRQVQIAKIGTKYSQIAVSPDGSYLAALRGGSLYIGPVDGPLLKREGSGYTTMSWDANDRLWTTSDDQIFTFRGAAAPGSAQGKAIMVTVPAPYSGLITAVRIAPDGVRVALVVDSNELTFGAIVWQRSGPALGETVGIQLSPFNVSDQTTAGFTALTWYGPDNVITLANPGSTLTEYPVNGGSSTSQMLDQSVDSIAASSGESLIAGVAKGGILQALTLTGAWTPVPFKGFSPTYPG